MAGQEADTSRDTFCMKCIVDEGFDALSNRCIILDADIYGENLSTKCPVLNVLNIYI